MHSHSESGYLYSHGTAISGDTPARPTSNSLSQYSTELPDTYNGYHSRTAGRVTKMMENLNWEPLTAEEGQIGIQCCTEVNMA